jgi:predicted enzyme related to lactoylglutathione lyase
MASPVLHFEIGCRDQTKAAAFYRAVFDWEIGPGANPAALDIAPQAGGIGGHFTSLGHEPEHYVTIYIQVTDIAATLDAIVAQGGEKVVGPIALPGGGAFAWFKDPDGTTFGLSSPPP